MSQKKRMIYAAGLILAVLVADQLTKWIARQQLATADPLILWNGLVTLAYAENIGSFLGLGANLPEWVRFVILVIFNSAMIGFLGVFLFGQSNLPPGVTTALALVLAGGLGNLIDRLLFDGRVIDFLHLRLGFFQTGVFNVADVALMAGAAWLLVLSVRSGFERKEGGNSSG